MSKLINFNFENNEVKTILCENGDVLFHAGDLAHVLGFKNQRQAVASHVDNEDLHKIAIKTNGGLQKVNFTNESGMYALIFGSTKDEARRFKRWVTSEVLPSIRKTGSYQTPTPTQRTATPAELHAIKTKVHFISGNFHFKNGASAEIYNRLRVELHLPNIADIQPHQLDRAYAILDEIDRNAKSYAEFRYELDKLAQGAIIRQGRPYTPHIKAKLTKLGTTIGHAPDWTALQAQLA